MVSDSAKESALYLRAKMSSFKIIGTDNGTIRCTTSLDEYIGNTMKTLIIKLIKTCLPLHDKLVDILLQEGHPHEQKTTELTLIV